MNFNDIKINDVFTKDDCDDMKVIALLPPCVVFLEATSTKGSYQFSAIELENSGWKYEHQKEQWKPTEDERFVYVGADLAVESDTFSGDRKDVRRADKDMLAIGNCFPNTFDGHDRAKKCAAEIKEVFKKYQS